MTTIVRAKNRCGRKKGLELGEISQNFARPGGQAPKAKNDSPPDCIPSHKFFANLRPDLVEFYGWEMLASKNPSPEPIWVQLRKR